MIKRYAIVLVTLFILLGALPTEAASSIGVRNFDVVPLNTIETTLSEHISVGLETSSYFLVAVNGKVYSKPNLAGYFAGISVGASSDLGALLGSISLGFTPVAVNNIRMRLQADYTCIYDSGTECFLLPSIGFALLL